MLSPYKPVSESDKLNDPEPLPMPSKKKSASDVATYLSYTNIVYTVKDPEGNQSIILGIRDDDKVDKTHGRRGINFKVKTNSLFAILGPSGVH